MKNQIPAYRLTHIRHYYGDTKVLDIDRLDIGTGSITGLIGPNGSGKTTLLKLLAFADRPCSGIIMYKGKRAEPFSPLIRSKVTLLTQKPYLLRRSVFDNIAYGLKIRQDTENIESEIKTALSAVGLSYRKFAHRRYHELSGGEAQRVALAARLVLKPEVLLLDEPVASVDLKSAQLIRQAAIAARETWGTTLVIASHDLAWLSSICDTQISIFKGRIFNAGMENIITGPFEYKHPGTTVKMLENGQAIRLKAPADKKTASFALIKKSHIKLTSEKRPCTTGSGHINTLQGRITSMLLEKKTGYITAGIAVSNISFVVRLTPEKIHTMNLYPGKKIVLEFSPGHAVWF